MLKCAPPSFQFTKNAWFMILREDRRPLLVQAIPLHRDPSLQAMLIFVDPDSTAQPNPKGLERIFGLTPAEARLAVQLCLGERLADIARGNDASLAITRSQLAGVYGKTQTQRRTELVLLLSRLSILP
jgi:DNA-binding CsgD family transcriptional regulator